jgi:ribosomal subunit interface protein
MKQPLQIRFIGMSPSDAIESAVRKKAEKLDHYANDIMSCRVTVELAHKHQHQGRPVTVRVSLTMPEHELSVDRVHDEDAYVAVRDAFDNMTRQVDDVVRRRRGDEKQHAVPVRGEIVRFSDAEQSGFIRAADGNEYYFSAANLADVPFENLRVGAQVQFIEEVASQGRQAKRVSVKRLPE